jgi:hypothetical protein
MPSGHDPMGGYRFSLRDEREAFARRSCSNKKMERHDDSKKSHPALAGRPRKHGFHLGLQGGGVERLDDVVADPGLLRGDDVFGL